MRTLGLTAAIGILLVTAPVQAQDGDGARRRRTTRSAAQVRGGTAPRRATRSSVRVEAYPQAAQREADPPAAQREAYPAAQREAYPAAQRDAYPAAQRDAYPAAQRDAYPAAQRDAYPQTAQREAYPQRGSYPPVTQREAYPPAAQEDPTATLEEASAPAYAAAPAREPARSRVRSRYDPVSEPEPEVDRHTGLYLRLEGGVGYMYVALPIGDDGRYAGVASAGAIHAGATVQDKALLGVQVWGAALANPNYTSTKGTQKSGVNVYHLGVGPELTLYLSPSNFHVTAAVGATWLTVQTATGAARSKPGLGGRVVAGHEWWLGRRWGLGLAGALSFSSNQLKFDTGGWEPFSTWCAGLVTSLTYH